jgi:hypothetical protein
MGAPASTSRKRRPFGATIAAYGAAYVALLYSGQPIQRQADRLHAWWWRGYDAWPSGGAVHRVLDLLGHAFMPFLASSLVTIFVAWITVVPLAFLARTVARGRVRAGSADPLERARSWIAAHPPAVRALTVVPAALWALYVTLYGPAADGPYTALDQLAGYEKLGTVASLGIVAVLATVAATAFVRAGLRAFVAPIVDDTEPQRAEVAKDEIAFDAVAVTRETRAAIAAMMGVNAAALVLALSSHRSFVDPKVLAGFVAYATVAFGGAALFRHASRVAIGVDGVLVKGTSRTRFFAYRDLDAARVEGGDLLLVRRGRVVLRLQLHGDDASKRDAVLARIQEAVERVKRGGGAVSAQLVSTATVEQLARAAAGGADYRGAALTRDQLWALVEGPEIDASARTAAAQALARTSGPEERARLRVAAEQCAAPEVRVAIESLAEEEEAARGEAPAKGASRYRAEYAADARGG